MLNPELLKVLLEQMFPLDLIVRVDVKDGWIVIMLKPTEKKANDSKR